MSPLIHILSEILASPVLRVLLVIGAGLLLGNVPFPGGFKLGVAGVLFSGLLLGALSPGFTIPSVLRDLGLVLFVYGVGLQTGPGFFSSFRKDGLRLNTAVGVALIAVFLICVFLIHTIHLASDTIAGLFCGALTNTPALGAVTEAIDHGSHFGSQGSAVVVGYGIAYPFAIVVILSMIQFLIHRNRGTGKASSVETRLEARTLKVTHKSDQTLTVDGVEALFQVRITRIRPPNGQSALRHERITLRPGTLVTMVGSTGELEKAMEYVGEPSTIRLQAHSGDLEVADFHISNREICGRPIYELEAEHKGFVMSRIRRGDVELAASPSLTLQPGDEVRVVGHHSDISDTARFFGNSVTALSETSYLTFILGILLGLVVGQVPLAVPGLSAPLRLGMAGGPLLVGIFLGWLGRSGPLVWTMPYGLNLGIRNFGILLFLAAVGTNAGSSLPSALKSQGTTLILLALAITVIVHLVACLILKIAGERDLATLLGALSGLQTQPAALSFAASRASSEKVQLGYAGVYPLATILKIILAQLLLEIH